MGVLRVSSTRARYRSKVTKGSFLRISGQDQGGGTLTSPCLSSLSAVSPLIFNIQTAYHNNTVLKYCSGLL